MHTSCQVIRVLLEINTYRHDGISCNGIFILHFVNFRNTRNSIISPHHKYDFWNRDWSKIELFIAHDFEATSIKIIIFIISFKFNTIQWFAREDYKSTANVNFANLHCRLKSFDCSLISSTIFHIQDYSRRFKTNLWRDLPRGFAHLGPIRWHREEKASEFTSRGHNTRNFGISTGGAQWNTLNGMRVPKANKVCYRLLHLGIHACRSIHAIPPSTFQLSAMCRFPSFIHFFFWGSYSIYTPGDENRLLDEACNSNNFLLYVSILCFKFVPSRTLGDINSRK